MRHANTQGSVTVRFFKKSRMFGAFRAERGSDVGINKDIKNSKMKRD